MSDTRSWSIAIATAVAVHVAIFIPAVPPDTAAAAPTSVSVTLAPRPMAPPEPELEPELEPEPEVEPDAPPPTSTERRRTQARRDPQTRANPRDPSTTTNPEPPAAPRRIDLGSGGSGVVVRSDTGGAAGVPGGVGNAGGQTAPGPGGGGSVDGGGAGARSPWHPVSEIHLRKLPWPRRVPELGCEAARHGVQGTVLLGVQVRHDGVIHRVRVIEGIGGGCDEIAARALRRAAFDPAVGADGRPVDFEVRYEYAFERGS